ETTAPPPMPEPSVAAPEVPGDDAVVRVRFERVSGQLPAAAFTLPLDRVAESLREPHWITVPRRVVLAQLPDGAVQVDWAIVASQFPSLAFAPDPPMVAPPPPPPPPLPSPAPRIPVAAPAAAAPRREVSPEVVSRDALARLAACLAGAGTFDSWSGVVDNVPLVAFVSPNVLREPVAAAAACIAGLLGAAAGEQVTVRTARAAIIVTPAPTPVVIAARRPGAPVALLELRGARAAALVGRAGEGVALPPRALSLLAVEPRVAGLAGTLGAFGILEPAVLTDATGAARIYVFREPGREAEWLGELALAVWEGLGRARDADLGALVSVVFRQGRRRILVRSLGGRGTVLLAAAGPVARPGR